MKGQKKPKTVPKCNQTECLSSSQEQESMDFLVFDDQIQKNQPFFDESIHDEPQVRLRPSNLEHAWTLEDETMLIELHRRYGNKWTLLARHYPGMCENSIKNRFYSRLRKSIRKLNKAIGIVDLKKYNKFKLNIIFKLSNISEGKMAEKQKIVPQIFTFYREFLYTLIQFSDQNQNNPSKQSLQNIADLQNLILPLVALQNLFRLVRGQRVAKGKKKNIAYLRQFTFRLSLENQYEMVITRENILLLNGNQNLALNSNLNRIAEEKSEMISKEKVFMPSETFTLENRGSQKFSFGLRKESFDFEEQDQGGERSVDLFKDIQDADCKTQSEMWKDYLGHEMKEYDICGQAEQSLEHGINFGLYSFKSASLIDDSSIW